ncbi:MAG: hypothetical protein MUC53_07510 [Candidatus Contendobacter sp.]|jgi:hypothetical protein|nr:hypothetical protein [Candidatus Contendobacter sp.]
MRISTVEIQIHDAESVTVTEDTLSVDLSDGRTLDLAFAHIFRPKMELSPHLSPKNGRKLECFPHFDAQDFVWVRRFGKISRQVGLDAFQVAGFRPLVGGNLMKRVQI